MQNDWWTDRTCLEDTTVCWQGWHVRFLRGTEGRLCTLTSDPRPATLFGWKYPADRQRSHPPALVRAFQSLFSGRRTLQESLLARIPQVDVKVELDDPPTREEIKKATMQLKVGKSPGIDGIPEEVYQHGGEVVLDKLQGLFTNSWKKGTLPQDLRDAVIVSLYKNKGEKSDCSNYRSITLLSIAGKILARVLMNRLIPTIAQENTPETQCGLRPNRGTVDMIFVLRQTQEKCREQNRGPKFEASVRHLNPSATGPHVNL